jgi:hypothetical protein
VGLPSQAIISSEIKQEEFVTVTANEMTVLLRHVQTLQTCLQPSVCLSGFIAHGRFHRLVPEKWKGILGNEIAT